MKIQKKAPILPCIQLVRLIAAIGVMLSHVGFGDSYMSGIVFSAGVNLFFCISAFLMMYTTQNSFPAHFIKKRLIRLLPLYWTLTILTFFASKVIDGIASSDIGFDELIKSMLCIPYLREGLKTSVVIRPIVGPAWTLGYDVWFLFFFALSMKLSHKWRGVICSIAIVAIIILGNLLPQNPISLFLKRTYWINYIAGILVYYIWQWAKNKTIWRKKTIALWTIIILIGCCILFIGAKPLYINILASFAIITATLFGFAEKNMPKCVLWFGKISFSFYLTHYYIILIIGRFVDFEKLNILTCAGTLLSFILSLIAGYVGYYVFEEKLGNTLKKALIKSNTN